MKWLAAFLCMLAIPALAQDRQEEQTPMARQQFPMFVNCLPSSPEDRLLQLYDEIPMLEGQASIIIPGDRLLDGKIIIYLEPNGKTFTIMFEPTPDISCMIMSGSDIIPVVSGEPL